MDLKAHEASGGFAGVTDGPRGPGLIRQTGGADAAPTRGLGIAGVRVLGRHSSFITAFTMAQRGRKTRGKSGYMISAVAEMYNLHPQTLRLYEREGLLAPSRSQGNTRLYTDEDLEQLEVILKLTRELGVNLAGVEIILNMRKRMAEMEKEMRAFVNYVRTEFWSRAGEGETHNALVRVAPPYLSRASYRDRHTS
jgi:MerR family transcriptional regulator/heat shock protein HspR